MKQFLPEWTRQWGVMMAWPHQGTDWAALLHEAEQAYLALADTILRYESLLILCRDADHQRHISALLEARGTSLACVRFQQLAYNDTWARDFGPLAITDNGMPQLLDFRFNGWGGKHAWTRDDAVNRQLPWQAPLTSVDMVLEGGSLDTNGAGLLVTTSACLCHPNRNPQLTQSAIEALLGETLGVTDVLWLDSGELEGDDTDAHVDTLVRFIGPETLAYVQCADPGDSHFDPLRRMARQLQSEADRRGLNTRALPLPTPCYNRAGERLPATYANFLIINGAVLVPVYDVPTDNQAIEVLTGLFPDRTVEPVNCRALIEQHGSLHCVTMQLPEGVI